MRLKYLVCNDNCCSTEVLGLFRLRSCFLKLFLKELIISCSIMMQIGNDAAVTSIVEKVV